MPDRLGKHIAVLGRKDVGAGLTFGAALVLFSLGGWWLDSKLGTSPILLLCGVLLGGVGGFIHLVETVSPGTLFRSRRPNVKAERRAKDEK